MRIKHDYYRLKIIRKRCFLQLIGIIWLFIIPAVLIFHLSYCHNSVQQPLFSVVCLGRNKLLTSSSTKPKHRCSIPLADDPNRVLFPKRRRTEDVVERLTYVVDDEGFVKNGSQSSPLFGGHQSWSQREDSFKLNSTMKVHCGFMRDAGAEISVADKKYVEKCRFIVVSAIFEAYLWRDGHTFAISRHKFHQSIYEEADANKRRKRYCRPLIDLQMKIYRYEGLEPWSVKKNTISDVPEGAIVIREHTALNNLFSCLWFNEVNLFTPRDQLSFGYVVYHLKGRFKFFMFPNCEFNSLAILHSHTREHSSPIENEPGCNNDELNRRVHKWKETRGGLGLWTHPGKLDQVVLPPVVRTFREGRVNISR